jgi:hypothetical protein
VVVEMEQTEQQLVAQEPQVRVMREEVTQTSPTLSRLLVAVVLAL